MGHAQTAIKNKAKSTGRGVWRTRPRPGAGAVRDASTPLPFESKNRRKRPLYGRKQLSTQ
jgi:hypothetical protein